MNARVDLTSNGAVALVTLNDPPTRNALGYRMASEVRARFQDLAADRDVRVVVLRGADHHFCSGGNLNDALEMSRSAHSAARFMDGFNAMIRTVFHFPKPLIGVVEGTAAGGGLGLLLCSDVILLGRGATLMQAFVHVALAPDCGTSQLLAARVGMSRAKELTFTGRKLGAEEALRIGLCDGIHDDQHVLEAAQELAAVIASRSPLATSQAKQLMQRSWFASLNDVLEMEASAQCALLRTTDFQEGVTAFLEKRRPAFVGR